MSPYLEVLIRKIGKSHQNNTFRIYNKFEPCQIRCIKLKTFLWNSFFGSLIAMLLGPDDTTKETKFYWNF